MQAYIPPTANIGNSSSWNQRAKDEYEKSLKNQFKWDLIFGLIGGAIVTAITWWFVGILAEIYL